MNRFQISSRINVSGAHAFIADKPCKKQAKYHTFLKKKSSQSYKNMPKLHRSEHSCLERLFRESEDFFIITVCAFNCNKFEFSLHMQCHISNDYIQQCFRHLKIVFYINRLMPLKDKITKDHSSHLKIDNGD